MERLGTIRLRPFVLSFLYGRFVALSLVPTQIFSVYVLIVRLNDLSFGTHIELLWYSLQQGFYDAQKGGNSASFSSALRSVLDE